MNRVFLIVLIVVITLALVFITSFKQIEKFTVKENSLASKIKVLLKNGGDYSEYIQVLVENDNVSTNLAKLATFTQFGSSSTIYEILSKF